MSAMQPQCPGRELQEHSILHLFAPYKHCATSVIFGGLSLLLLPIYSCNLIMEYAGYLFTCTGMHTAGVSVNVVKCMSLPP